MLISVLRTPEIPPSEEELRALRAKKGGLVPALKEIGEAIVDMPPQFRKLALVYFFQWYGMVCYWQFIALSIAKEFFPPTQEGKEAVSYTHLRAHETVLDLVCRLLLENKKPKIK